MGADQTLHQPRLSVTGLVKLLRKTEQYFEWEKQVFLRDRFACQRCGKRNGRRRVITAHHLQGFTSLVRQSGVKTLEEAEQCSLLWGIDNGQTLCYTCHELTETYPTNFKKK